IDCDALIIGVEPRKDAEGNNLCPNIHLEFVHPDKMHNLGGSGWNDANEAVYSVRPASHPDVCYDGGDTEHVAYYMNEDVDDELRAIRRAKQAAEFKAEADKA